MFCELFGDCCGFVVDCEWEFYGDVVFFCFWLWFEWRYVQFWVLQRFQYLICDVQDVLVVVLVGYEVVGLGGVVIGEGVGEGVEVVGVCFMLIVD